MYNFCHPSLNPLVTCSTISSEGYEITNLVSSDWSKRQRGFMVYNSIKPPVDLTFKFMCNIKLSHIIIWPQIGCQKSSGFELLTCSPSPSLHKLDGHSKDNVNVGSDFVRVGCGFLNDEAGIVFHVTNIPTSSFPSNFLMKSLYNKQNSLYKTDNLRIKILKTDSSSLPAIAKIEVWGSPSRSCTQDTRMEVLQLWNSSLSVPSKVKKSKPKDDRLLVTKFSVAAPIISHTEFAIPEEFLDAITCEVMVIPVTLPCGKVVDQSTLEKHKDVEANWGRTPSDPFTGQVFTDVSRPIVAVSLKARIDKFIVENVERKELQNIPRTVGRKQGATLKELSIPKKDNHEGSGKRSRDFVSFDELNHKRKRTVLSGVSKQKETSVLSSVISDNEVNRSFRNVKACSVTSSTQRSYEDILDDSLNSALKSTLSKLPTFLNFDCKKVLAQENVCTKCEGSDNLFELPCSHLLCRSCLVQKTHAKQLNCIECNDVFRSSDPKRYHV